MKKENTIQDVYGDPSEFPRGVGVVTRMCLLLPPAFLLSLKFDLPHILIFTFTLLVVPCFFRSPLQMRERPIIYLSLTVFIMAFLPGFITKIPESRLTFVDYLMRSHIFLPLLLYFAALIAWFRRSRGRISVILLISLIAALISSDIFNTSGQVNTVFSGTTPLLKAYRDVYRICVGIQCFGTLLLLTSSSRYDTVNRPKSLLVCRLLAFMLIPVFFLGARVIFFASEDIFTHWRNMFRSFVQNRSGAYQSFFPTRSGISNPPEYFGEPNMLIQAIASSAPGYLRGKAYRRFTEYDGGTWYADESKAMDMPEIEMEKDLTVLSFSLRNDWKNDSDTAEIRFLMHFSGEVLPTPTNASAVTLDAKNIGISQEGCVLPEEWNHANGCVFLMTAPANAPTAALYPGETIMPPNSERFRSYLDIPYSLRQLLTERALAIIDNRNPESIMPRKRVRLVTQYLTDHYTYSLEPDHTDESEYRSAVARFLFETKQGHCELFASSAALLLRAIGVPTRYVVGIVCHDYHPSGYYYATDRDLHAWAEAWLEDEKCWIRVEATPGDAIGSKEQPPAFSSFDIFTGKLKLQFENLLYWIRRGYPARAVSNVWFIFYYGIRDYAMNHPMRTAGILLVIISFTAGIILLIRHHAGKVYSIPENLRRAARFMIRTQMLISAQVGIPRAMHGSLRSWAMSVDSEELINAVSYYESIRFSGHDCTARELHKLKLMLKTARKTVLQKKRNILLRN